MEIYKDDTQSVFQLPVPLSILQGEPRPHVDVEAHEEGDRIYVYPNVAASLTPPTGYQVTLPWELVKEDRDFFLDWSVDYEENTILKEHRERMLVSVVTPILPIEEVARISEFTDANDIKDLERRVRIAIQTYTGQNFGKFRTTMEMRGNGSSRMQLPAPLLGVYDANFNFQNFAIHSSGWSISIAPNRSYNIKQAPPDAALVLYYTDGPIMLLPGIPLFNVNAVYRITGLWGYHDTPEDVKQAARMLIADYACDESLWRERYIKSVRAGNWRFDMDAGAFAGTGNVFVDQILDKYRRLTLAVV